MEINSTTRPLRRPNPSRYLAAISALCYHGMVCGSETEAVAVLRAISQDSARFLGDWQFDADAIAYNGLSLVSHSEQLRRVGAEPG